MPSAAVDRGPDLFGWWIQSKQRKAAAKASRAKHLVAQGLRFAFYGRMSTEDYQDVATSGQWQRDFAEELVADHGKIVAQYFDVGYTRALAWHHRPQAAKLCCRACRSRSPVRRDRRGRI